MRIQVTANVAVHRPRGNERSLWSRWLGSSLLREHLPHNGKNFRACFLTDSSQLPYQPDRVYCPELVKNDLPGLASELAWDPRGIGSPFCCHGGYDYCANMMVYLVGRYDYARSRLLDLMANCRIQIYKKDVETVDYHSHSPFSHAV